jgi:hypothetical protein
MLKEVEVAQPLDLCVVNRVLAGRFGMSKSRARHEIDLNRDPALSRIEINRLHEPWSLDAKRSLEQWVGHERWCLPPPAGRSAALVGDAGRPRRQSASSATLWICGRREEAPPTTPQGQQQKQGAYIAIGATHSKVKRGLLVSVGAVDLKHVLGDIQPDRGNLHLDGSPHVIRTTITLWHFDAGSGRRPPHQNLPSGPLSKVWEIA